MTRENVVKLYQEFHALSGYVNKLSYFEKQFQAIFELFPVFDPSLSILSDPVGIELLTGIYKRDSVIYAGLKKDLRTEKKIYVLDVRPFNSNRLLFNQFVVEGFLKAAATLNSSPEATAQIATIEPEVGVLLDNSHRQLTIILEYLQQKKTRNFRIQFMKVFYEGYSDRVNNLCKTFTYKKKMIELFLYAQGIFFADYRQQLKAEWMQREIQVNLADTQDFKVLDWRDQVLMLKNMGIIDVLKERIKHPVASVKRKKIDRIICRIIGQQPYMTDSITEFINRIDCQF